MNSVSYFEIHSSEPTREINFYKNVFGWKFIKEALVAVEYYRIETNGINGGLLKWPAEVTASESGVSAFVCSIQVENFDRTSDLVIQNGGKVAVSKFAIPGRCWQGYFRDASNNIFGLFEVDENAG